MSLIFIIVRKEILTAVRERQIFSLGVVIVILLAISVYAGLSNYNQRKLEIDRTQREERGQWLNQGEKHPHIAAHFGTYVFKPKSVLSLFDPGLDNFTGTSVYLEAHYQHEFMFRPAQDHSSMIRFGKLSTALVLQVLVPLLIIFLAFNSFTKEHEGSTLRLLASQGIAIRTVAWGKILAYLLIVGTVLLPLLIVFWFISTTAFPDGIVQDVSARVLILFALYQLYLFAFIVFSVCVSLWCRSSRTSLLALIICWTLFTVIVPKAVANSAESLYPIPSMKIFREAIQKDIAEGNVDDKGPRAVRIANLEREYLQRYDVDTVSELPLNLEGISMQVEEEYANKVYGIHWNRLTGIFNKQNRMSSFASFMNPYLAIRNLSMGLSGTDLQTAIDFQDHVRDYRIALIGRMNQDMAQNSKYGEFFEYQAGKKLWSEIREFHYNLPTVSFVFSCYRTEWLALVTWTTLLIVILNYSSKRVKPINE